jgi:subtilisin family serine protease
MPRRARRTPPLLGEFFKKFDPKLRMVANGSSEVNEIRAASSPSVQMAAAHKPALDTPEVEKLFARAAIPVRLVAKTAKVPALRQLASDVRVSVFVEHDSAAAVAQTAKLAKSAARNERGRLAILEAPLSELPRIAEQPSVIRIEMGEALKRPRPGLAAATTSAPGVALRRFAAHGGENVLVGIIDVDGFDFAHEDFLDDDGGTRFVSIWDQGGSNRQPPENKRLSFGSEILKEHMDAAIDAADDQGMAPQLLEPQSSMVHGSHGTHVASIAAGNRGVCRGAFLTGVLIDLPVEDADRRKSFYDSTRIAHAVDYILDVAERLQKEHQLETLPVTINISLGTNGHAHDGSSAVCRWLEHLLATPGRAVTVAAGNAGQEAPESADDIGFIMGRIHTSGRVAAAGLTNEIDWRVVGNGAVDVSENELEIWYSPSDRFAVSVKPPGQPWTEFVQPGQFIENRQLPDKSFLSIYNELYHPANGANYIGVFLTPFFSQTQIVGITPGSWRIRLQGVDVRDGRYHGWIERDDPVEIGPVGQASAWRFPSFFSETSNVDNSSVSSLGCGEQVLCVANWDDVQQKINISSSQGPTRDSRLKPDLAAPGTEIVAALGFNFENDEQWIAMTGTSMASPFVCGVVGLMLAENPRLTAAQIRGILQRTSQPLPNASFEWRNDAGHGVVDPEACLEEVRRLDDVEDLT